MIFKFPLNDTIIESTGFYVVLCQIPLESTSYDSIHFMNLILFQIKGGVN